MTRRTPGRSLVPATLALVTAMLAAVAGRPAAQAPSVESPCDIHTSERIVAIGDVHGAYDRFAALLRGAQLTDRRDRWIGGRARLVQTGDVLDRGPDSRKVIDLLRRLEREAAAAGGRVHALLGNHEFMRLVGDWRYVSAGELKAFQNADSADLRERAHDVLSAQAARRAREENRPFDAREYRALFMKDIPLGHFEMQLAFAKDGEYGKWVRSRVAAVKINGILFVHGGISDTVADLGCDGLNAAVQQDLAAAPVPVERIASLLSSSETGPLWYRGLASEPEDAFAPELASILQRMAARAIVIGHTPTTDGTMQTRFGGRVVLIDTGMLNGEFYPRGAASALEIHGEALTALYGARRQALDVPALRATN